MGKTEIVSSKNPQAIQKALEVLQAGGLVAYPTDTVYGLAADPRNETAIDKIYAAKDRVMTKAIAVLVGEAGQVSMVASALTPSAEKLAARFWPGALTLVVPRRSDLPENLSAYPTIGVRMPDHPLALALLRAAGPLATTSANLSGGADTQTAAEVLAQLDGRLDLILDGGACPGGVPSTVVDCTGADVRILRQGAIPAEEIYRITGISD